MSTKDDQRSDLLAPCPGYTHEQEPRVNEGMAGGGRRFPVHPEGRDKRLPATVPWEMVAPHEEQAWKNHGQTLARLAQRGGLSVRELWSVVHDKHWHPLVPEAVAVEWLLGCERNGAQGYIVEVSDAAPSGGATETKL